MNKSNILQIRYDNKLAVWATYSQLIAPVTKRVSWYVLLGALVAAALLTFPFWFVPIMTARLAYQSIVPPKAAAVRAEPKRTAKITQVITRERDLVTGQFC